MVQFSRLRLPFMKTQTLLLIFAFVANCEGSFYRATARCRPTFAACRRAGLSMSQRSEQRAIDCTRAWIEHVVIRLRLCPYASKPFLQEQIRYTVSDAEDDGELLNDFFGEVRVPNHLSENIKEGEPTGSMRCAICGGGAHTCMRHGSAVLVSSMADKILPCAYFGCPYWTQALLIQDTTQEELTTTMLVAPKYKGNGVEFYDLYVYLTDLLESEDEDILNNEVRASGTGGRLAAGAMCRAQARVYAAPSKMTLPRLHTIGACALLQIQPAFFHPDWEFDGLPPDAALHFEKRAPFPVINLLRRKQLDQVRNAATHADTNRFYDVVKEGLERGIIVNKEISEHNEKRLYEEGYDALTAIFAQIMDNPRQAFEYTNNDTVRRCVTLSILMIMFPVYEIYKTTHWALGRGKDHGMLAGKDKLQTKTGGSYLYAATPVNLIAHPPGA
eukprot:6213597-Pleurochrysis_carterae.AAC.2